MTRTYIPSTKTILKYLTWLDPDKVKTVRGLMDGTLDPEETSGMTAQWVKSCHNAPSEVEKIMHAIDCVMGTHGVEALFQGGWVVATYCNTGETYTPTIMYFKSDDKFRVMSWGDYAESHQLD